MGVRSGALLVALAWIAAAPGVARAATAEVGTCRSVAAGSCADYRAGAGEANDVVVRVVATSFTPGNRAPYDVSIRDAGAVIAPGPGCVRIDDHEVRCDAVQAVGADAGDLADVLSVQGLTAEVHGGAGDDRLTIDGGTLGGEEGADTLAGAEVQSGDDGADVLTGTSAGDRLDGGSGDDVLTGLPGADLLVGGGGSDQLAGGANRDVLQGDGSGGHVPAPDVIDGGDGDHDAVSYAGRSTGVGVDLTRPDDAGATDEHDRLVGVEDIVGGAGPDSLGGDGAANRISGGAGADLVQGRGGDDRLGGGPGGDGLDGGAGADTIDPTGFADGGRAGADVVACGTGRDRVDRAVAATAVRTDCERVDGLALRAPAGRSGLSVGATAACEIFPCRAVLSLRAATRLPGARGAGRLLGRRAWERVRGPEEGAHRRLKARLSRRTSQRLGRRRGGGIRVTFVLKTEVSRDLRSFAILLDARRSASEDAG